MSHSSSISRRDFLATSATVAAVPALAGSQAPAAIASPLAVKGVTVDLWAVGVGQPGGRLDVTDYAASEADAIAQSAVIPTIRRVSGRFTGTLFRLRRCGWDAERGERALSAAPAHALDIPEVLNVGESAIDEADTFSNRSAAMQAAAEWNRSLTAKGDRGALKTWAVVVEVGDQLPGTAFAAVCASGDIAIETATIQRPVRLVRPTAEEIRWYVGAEV